MTTGVARRLGLFPALALLAAAAVGSAGCQQKMAEQPYYRPYEPTVSFPDGRSNRPLEVGVVHRGQKLDSDPLATGLTAEEWGRFWKRGERKVDVGAAAKADEDRETAYGAPRFDQRQGGPKVYAEAFPFEITEADVLRGERQFSAYCAMCHGPLGNGKGKIWERGYLKPTSYHTEQVDPNEPPESGEIPLGFSRGYWRWGIRIPVREVPVGYIFEVITKGYGAMPDHAAQIRPDDRWRIAAYVRVLQMSMHADAAGLPEDVRKRVNEGGAAPGGHK